MILIPKIFHRIWLGPDPMPQEFIHYGETWEDNNPCWEMKLWTDHNLPSLINEQYLDECETYSEKSDLIRYELLYKYGGIYIDTDFENFKPIDLLIDNLEIFASTEDNKHICGGFFGSRAGHPLLKQLIDNIPQSLKNNKGKTSDLKIGPTFVTSQLKKSDITILPKKYFYPYLPGQNNIKKKLHLNTVAYAAHHWAASWLKKIPKEKNISIIIPYKEDPKDTKKIRRENFAFTLNRFRETFPQAQFIIGRDHPTKTTFSRARAINNGVKKAKHNLLIITDADLLLKKETLTKAIKHTQKHQFTIPFGRVANLTQKFSKKIIQKNLPITKEYHNNIQTTRDIRPGHSQWGDKRAGGIHIITKELFDKVGGYDERFEGYGYEDTQFCWKIEKELKNYDILEDEWAYHLYHPPSGVVKPENYKLAMEEKKKYGVKK